MRGRERVPWRVRRPIRRVRNAVTFAGCVLRQLQRWWSIARTGRRLDELAVSYGYERMPAADEVVLGGNVKFALLHGVLPNAPVGFNVLYLGSSAMPLEAPVLVRLARRRGAAFVWNQNGVAYPGWYGVGWELVNGPRAKLLLAADHVFYQSEFCKLSADRFYGEREGGWEILYNPVDTGRFVPAIDPPTRPLTLLLGGSQYQRYKLELALQTLANVKSERPDARLLVAGALSFAADGPEQARRLVEGLGLDTAVEFTGPYPQAEAPELMRRADILLHPKYNDPCPTVVLEAMACGLPVVYSATGGVPELVGKEAGVGLPAPLDWERDHLAAPAELAAAVHTVAERLEERREAARARAQEFDARRWTERHREVFEGLRAR